MRVLRPIVAPLLCLAGFAPACAAAPVPPDNLPVGELPMACYDGSESPAVCQNDVIYYLNANRATMGLGPYALPADFTSLSPDRQIFILSNLDRIAYGLPPVTGLNMTLSAAALDGVHARGDPEAPAALSTGPVVAWGSNWAAGFLNVPYAYNAWMFNDCPNDPECWGHRENILGEYQGPGKTSLAMGAATGTEARGEAGYAQLIVATSGSDPDYYYTWAEAEADGAGTYPYDPGTPALGGEALRPNLALLALRRHGRPVALRVRSGAVLRGVVARLTFVRQRRVELRWRRIGATHARRLTLGSSSKIRLPRLRRGQRLVVRVRTRPFVLDGRRVLAAFDSIFLTRS